ncbi:MAG TPA: archaetidylserine decarboxylase [Gammaproteobacteria bacterium]|nr:archaetidylserine decarboxylase [Gammaproteobacteria bacterium]
MSAYNPNRYDRLAALAQYLLPQHGLSRLWHYITRREQPWLKNRLIHALISRYDIDLSEAADPNPTHYASLNAFFTRSLRPDARPVDSVPESCVSPVDGRGSQFGVINKGRIFQAKGREFDARELLGGDTALAECFAGGSFATLYLAPRDYHRVHMPLDGTLERMIYIPGRLFSVNPATTRAVPRLFARNERVAMLFATPAGPMAVVMVGAMLVGSIETVWAGEITPPPGKRIREWRYGDGGTPAVTLTRGEEVGRFNMGSTVILLFARDAVEWAAGLGADSRVLVGQRIGTIKI